MGNSSLIIAQVLRTVFIGVGLFLVVASTCGVVVAMVRLRYGKNLPDVEDRRVKVMAPVEGADPLGSAPRRPPRAEGLAPIQPQSFKKARRV